MSLHQEAYRFRDNTEGVNLQAAVRFLYARRGYTEDINVLALGLCEEAGEVAAAVLDLTPHFKSKPERAQSDLEHELKDCLMYLLALANSAGIDLGI